MATNTPTPARGPWYRITTSEKNNEATVMLYDAIGDYYDIDDDGYWRNVGVKDTEFVKEIERLDAIYATIHVRINSPGGEIWHGAAIVNAIRRCKAEVHTWNDGIAASMAAVIWAAGQKRHMAKNATLMFHSGLWVCIGNPQEMRYAADTLDKMNDSMIAGMAETLDMTEDEIRAAWFADYKDHWLTHADATAAGIINATTEYQITDDDPPATAAGMDYRRLLAQFHKTQHPDERSLGEQARAMLQKAFAAVTGGKAHQHSPTNTIDMNLEEFKASIAAGTLSADAVKAHLATLEPAPDPAAATPPPATAPQPDAKDAEIKALNTTVADLTAKIETMQAAIAALGEKPGAQKADPGVPPADPAVDPAAKAGADADLRAYNEAMAKAAATHNNPLKRAGSV